MKMKNGTLLLLSGVMTLTSLQSYASSPSAYNSLQTVQETSAEVLADVEAYGDQSLEAVQGLIEDIENGNSDIEGFFTENVFNPSRKAQTLLALYVEKLAVMTYIKGLELGKDIPGGNTSNIVLSGGGLFLLALSTKILNNKMNIKSQKTINLLRNSGRYLNSNEFYLIKNGVNAQRAQIISALEENKASDKVKVVQPAKAVKKGKVATNSAIGQQMNKSSQPKAAVIPEPMNPKKAAKLALKTNLVKNDQLTKVGKQTQKALTDKFINLTNEVRSINNALVKYNNLGAANAEKSIIETNLEVTRKNTVAASQKAYNASFTGDLAGSKRFHTEVSKLNTAESVANMKLEIVKGSIQSSEEAIRKLPNELRVTDKFTMQDLVKKSKAVMSKAEAAGIKISQFDNGVKTLADLKQEVKYLAKRTEKRFFVGKEFWVKSGRYTINTVKTLATKSVLGIAAIEGLIYTLGNASNVVFEYGELDSEEMTARFYNQLIKVDAEITALSK